MDVCMQNTYGLWAESAGPFQSFVSVEKAIFTFTQHKSDIYEWSNDQLRVNTSLFAW